MVTCTRKLKKSVTKERILELKRFLPLLVPKILKKITRMEDFVVQTPGVLGLETYPLPNMTVILGGIDVFWLEACALPDMTFILLGLGVYPLPDSTDAMDMFGRPCPVGGAFL